MNCLLMPFYVTFEYINFLFSLQTFRNCRIHNPPAVAFTIKSPCYSVRLPISLGHVVLPSAFVMLGIFFFTRRGLIIQRASCIMVDVFRVFKEIKYIFCFTSDEILIIYRKIKITQILPALL